MNVEKPITWSPRRKLLVSYIAVIIVAVVGGAAGFYLLTTARTPLSLGGSILLLASPFTAPAYWRTRRSLSSGCRTPAC